MLDPSSSWGWRNPRALSYIQPVVRFTPSEGRGVAPCKCQFHFVSAVCRKFLNIYLYINGFMSTSVASDRVLISAGPTQ